MSKTEAALMILVLVVLAFGLWFVLSGNVLAVISWLETLLYPAIVTPV
jgi:hypothetical protein